MQHHKYRQQKLTSVAPYLLP